MKKVTTTAKMLLTLLILFITCYKQGSYASNSGALCSGEQLTVTCSTNGSALSWKIFVPHLFMQGTRKVILASSPDNSTAFIGGIPFQFFKSLNSLLMSSVVVDGAYVTSDLDETMLNCTRENERLMTTTIMVIGNDTVIPNNSAIIVEEQFWIENVTVVLEWAEEEHVAYNVTIFPHIPMRYIRKNVIQLTVPYNHPHKVSVVATLCGHHTTNVTELYYGELGKQEPILLQGFVNTDTAVKCESPPSVSPDSASGFSVINITDHDIMSPALVGSKSSVTISCSEEVGEYSKTVTIICMDDAKWHLQDDNHTKCGVANLKCHSSGMFEPMPCSTTNSARLNTAIIIGIPITGVVFILLFLVTCLVAVTLFIKKGLCTHNYKENAVSQNIQQPETDSRQVDHDIHSNLGVYSLLQPSMSWQHDGAAPVNIHMKKKGQTPPLVYADIGPLSSEQKNHIILPETLDDTRIEYAQINTHIMSSQKNLQPVNSTEHHSADDSLNLDCLLIQIKHQITPHWCQFGKALEVESKVLDKCSQHPPEESIIEVCDSWLRNHTGQPTWREVAEALRQINFQKLAFDIEKVYESGKLPVDSEEEMLETEISQSVCFKNIQSNESPPPIPPRLM